jgi:hypothetical protein
LRTDEEVRESWESWPQSPRDFEERFGHLLRPARRVEKKVMDDMMTSRVARVRSRQGCRAGVAPPAAEAQVQGQAEVLEVE